jgi:polysaccharide pyruvyl transferase WcaK-like protein
MSRAIRVGVVTTAPGGRIDRPESRSTADLYNMCGHNVGNLAFWGAVTALVDAETVYFPWSFLPEEVNEKVDVLVFPAANQLNPRFDLGSLAALFERVNVPLVVIGLGAQAATLGGPVELKDGTIRWLRVIGEKAALIGARGMFSADVMAAHGVKNVEVTGCPSFQINPSETLGAQLAAKSKGPFQRISVNQGDVPSNVRKAEAILCSHVASHDSQYVIQAPQLWISAAMDRFQELSEDERAVISGLFPPESNVDSKKIAAYFDYKDWIRSLTNYDLSIGTRIHGNILALQAGVPAICIDHDSRTRELSETIMMPRMPIRTFIEWGSVEALIERFQFDWSLFDTNRRMLRSRVRTVFEAAGVPVRLPRVTKAGTARPEAAPAARHDALRAAV